MAENKLNPTVLVYISVLIFLTFLSMPYLIAVTNGGVPPYPQTSISWTGHRMPQCLFFRTMAIPLCILLAVVTYMQYSYMSFAARQGTNKKHANRFIWILGSLSAFCFSVSTAYLSDYEMNHFIHVKFATATFLIIFVQMIIVTVEWYLIRKVSHDKYLPNKSYYAKVALVVIGVITAIISEWGEQYIFKRKIEGMDNIVEWWSAQLITVYFLTLVWDFKNTRLTNQYQVIKG